MSSPLLQSFPSFAIDGPRIHKEYQRKLISDKVAKPVRDAAIIHLMILRDGPKDLLRVEEIIQELKRKKDKSENAIDTEFYLTQIEAYEMLRNQLSCL